MNARSGEKWAWRGLIVAAAARIRSVRLVSGLSENPGRGGMFCAFHLLIDVSRGAVGFCRADGRGCREGSLDSG